MQETLTEPLKEPLRRYFYDFEYIEIEPFVYLPISVGIVPEDPNGETYYAVFEDYIDRVPPDHWVAHNVLPHLGDVPWKKASIIASEMLSYFYRNKQDSEERIEIWAYQDDHDRHLFCSLFGGQTRNAYVQFHQMGIRPVLPRDVVHLQGRLDWPRLPEQKSGKHNALEDAKWHRQCFEHLKWVSLQRGVSPDPIIPYDFLPRAGRFEPS